MSQVENLTIYFVLPSENANEEDASDDMKLAFSIVLKYGGNAKWINPSSCIKRASCSKDVFVFEKFDGEAFEDLKKYSAKILGARCMMTCLSNGRSIPNSITPVFTEGMRDLVISCTGFDSSVKKIIQQRVEYMAGIYVRSLRGLTTHLIAYNNISSKAVEAYKSNLPIMRYEWVEAVWEKSIIANVNGKDDEFNKFVSPLFHNLKITTSGIAKKEKEKIKELIESNGGTFTGALEEKSTNILIVSKPEGEKFKFAKSWNIICIKPSWLFNCVSTHTILPLNKYVLEDKNPKSSTPKKDEVNLTANFSMMSAIAHDSEKLITHLEETHATLSSETVKSQFQTPKRIFVSESYSDIINNVLIKNLREAGQFLDGCNIYLCGFKAEDLEMLKKVLNIGGATRFNDLTEFVTHVIIGKKSDNLTASLKNSSAYILSINWLVESMKLKKPAPEADFIVYDNKVKSTEPPSPLSKLGAKLLTSAEKKVVAKPRMCLHIENDKLSQMKEEMLRKYKESEPGLPLPEREDPLSRSTNSSLQSRTNSIQSNDEIFKGLTFFLSNELVEKERKQIEDIISERSGRVVGTRFLGKPDYAIVPICGASLTETTTKEVVNVFFIKDCCLEENIVSLQYYHQPVACVKGATPLKNCVISVSNYVQCEREFIETLIEILGAIPQSLLARKPKENILKSTHLVCADPTGQKYNGALRWGLPVVHHDWLLKCAALGIRVSEQPYLIGESKLSVTSGEAKDSHIAGMSKSENVLEKPPESKTCHNTNSSQLKSDSKLHADSPVHATIARLKNSETTVSNSPDVNRTLTPNSPYGAFYGNDNPSPSTRKRLWKWMHQGADFPQDPPMNYQAEPSRRDSTPLSTVLSKLLVEMKRKPEEIPSDSPIISNKRSSFPDGDSPVDVPFKKINLDSDEKSLENKIKHNSLITTGLQKMKEIEERYAKNCAKPPTPIRKQSDSAPQMLVVTESQPHTEVGWEDPNEKEIALNKLEKAAEGELRRVEKLFMLTRLTSTEEVAKLIEQCGGKVSTLPHFDKKATHLISKDLTRDEKLMASIAAGLWVLHPSYIEQLRIVRDVYKITEEHYEWGNPNETARMYTLPANTRAFAPCSYDWRMAIRGGTPRPFKNMKIILHLRMSKYENFKRLIEAGDGEVVSAKPPYRDDVDAKICVVEAGYTEEIDFEALARRNIPCVTILFISDHILNKSDAIENNLVQTFVKYWKRK